MFHMHAVQSIFRIFLICASFAQSQSYEENENLPDGLSLRIMEGVVVSPHGYPFLVALTMHKHQYMARCGASLISELWILTAAHCFEDKPDYVIAFIGAHNLNELQSMIIMFSLSYMTHKDWDRKTYQHDIALVKLPYEVALGPFVKPVELSSSNDLYVNANGTMLGWGRTEDFKPSSELRQMSCRVITNEECSQSSKAYKKAINSGHICTSCKGIGGTCDGDSGGPLLVDAKQIGIASFGDEDCSQIKPSVFTRIADNYDWIMEHINNGRSGVEGYNKVAVIFYILSFLITIYNVI